MTARTPDASTIAEVAVKMFAARKDVRTAKGRAKGLAVGRANRLHAQLVSLMVAGVREHAVSHYEHSGWDFVVEAYTDDELAEIIDQAESLNGAIRRVGRVVAIHHESRQQALAA